MKTTIICLFALGCASTQVSQTCSDKAYAALVARCAAAAVSCRQQGGTEEECGTVCDQAAGNWQKECSK